MPRQSSSNRLKNTGKVYLTGLKNFLYPPLCPACQTAVPEVHANRICSACSARLVPFPEARCRWCGGVVDGVLDSCGECLQNPSRSWQHAVSVFPYGGYIRELIHRFKYRRATALAPYFAAEMSANWRIHGVRKPDMAVSIPMHWGRFTVRGYNQAGLLAAFIGHDLAIPVVHALKRKKHSRRQASLNYDQRKANIKNIFSCSDKTNINSCHILLIDDVLTTGATLDGATRVLTEAGAGMVSVLTLARG